MRSRNDLPRDKEEVCWTEKESFVKEEEEEEAVTVKKEVESETVRVKEEKYVSERCILKVEKEDFTVKEEEHKENHVVFGLKEELKKEEDVYGVEERTDNLINTDSISEDNSPSIIEQDDAPSRPAVASTPEPAPVTAPTSSTPQIRSKRKREQDDLAVLREMQESDVEQQALNRAQREQHLQMALEDAARARELEAALRSEENASTAAFNTAFLGTLNQLVRALSRRADNTQPPLD
ncbi:hypothetical protein UPYG_G00058760 [Umbra pygmaea]|uniref:Uncharacterized protein n=1 Tax=Umbra pygmaea TaxID=75934 RepID=A0ABD0XNV9_UMBPY